MSSSRFAVLFLSLLLATQAYSQTKAPAKRKVSTQPTPSSSPIPTPTSSPTPVPPNVTPFDIQATQLPASYEGNSFTAVYARFSAKPKGEFETTAEYRARMPQNEPRAYYAFLADDLSGTLATGSSVAVTYDADAQQFKVKVFLFPPLNAAKPDITSVSLATTRTRTLIRKYMGSNAFGVKQEISEYEATADCVFGDRATLGLVGKAFSIERTFPMPLEQARIAKNSLRALFIASPYPGGPDGAVSYTTNQTSQPTRDGPAEVHTTTRTIAVNDLRVWVFDYSTGVVLLRTDLAPR